MKRGERNMKINLGKYSIVTDERQYKVKSEVGVAEDGTPITKNLGYFTTLEKALKFIPEQIVRENDDLMEISNKLDLLKGYIEEKSEVLF